MNAARLSLAALFALALLLPAAFAQGGELPIRVKVSSLNDGSTLNSTLDENTRTCIEETKDSGGKLISKKTYQLDPQNRPLTGVVEDGKGNFLYNVTYKNDAVSGLVLQETDTDKAGQTLRRIVFNYNNRGQLTGTDVFDGNGNPIQTGAAIKDRDKKKATRH